MVQEVYCSGCGLLLESQSQICPSCGKENVIYSEKPKILSIPFNNYLFFILIVSILSPTFNTLITSFLEKSISISGNFKDFILYITAQNIINFIISFIFVLFLLTKGHLIKIGKDKRELFFFTAKVFLVSLIGTFIYTLLNNIILVPFINSIQANANVSTSLFTLHNFQNYWIFFLFNNGIFFVLVSIFAMIFNKRIKTSRDFKLLNYSLYLIIIGFIMGFLPIVLLNPIFIGLGVSHLNFLLSSSISNLIENLLIILIPVLFVLVLTKLVHFSFPRKGQYFMVLMFLFALIGRFLGFFFVNNGILFGNSQIPLFNTVVYEISFSLYGSLFGTIVFFAVFFLLQEFSTQPLFEAKQQLGTTKGNFDINPSLEKIESILRENTE